MRRSSCNVKKAALRPPHLVGVDLTCRNLLCCPIVVQELAYPEYPAPLYSWQNHHHRCTRSCWGLALSPSMLCGHFHCMQASLLEHAGIPSAQVGGQYVEMFRLDDPIGGEHMNIFKAGLLTAHRVVAVSHGCSPTRTLPNPAHPPFCSCSVDPASRELWAVGACMQSGVPTMSFLAITMDASATMCSTLRTGTRGSARRRRGAGAWTASCATRCLALPQALPVMPAIASMILLNTHFPAVISTGNAYLLTKGLA